MELKIKRRKGASESEADIEKGKLTREQKIKRKWQRKKVTQKVWRKGGKVKRRANKQMWRSSLHFPRRTLICLWLIMWNGLPENLGNYPLFWSSWSFDKQSSLTGHFVCSLRFCKSLGLFLLLTLCLSCCFLLLLCLCFILLLVTEVVRNSLFISHLVF